MEKRSSFIRKEIWLLLILAASFVAAFYAYPILPDKVPSHWGINGEVNGYSSRFFGAFGIPLMNLGLYVLFLVLPNIDPKKRNYSGFEPTYRFIRYLMHMFFIGMQAMIILSALGYPVNMGMMVKLFVGLLFILMGNVMGRFKHNYFVGIKTPWTLASEEVWTKTHRVAAPIWVIGGVIGLVNAFINGPLSAMIMAAALIVMVFVPTIYSYIVFTKLGKKV